MKPNGPTANNTHERIQAVRQQLVEWQVDGVIIHGVANRRWLSGFTGSNAQLAITQNKAILATDFRYWQQATIQAPDFELFKHQRTDEDNANFIKQIGVQRLGLEASHITLSEAHKLQKLDAITWVPLESTLEPLRQLKTAVERDNIQKAAQITDQTMAQVKQLAKPGMSERQLAWQLERIMREAGAESTAFNVIVASGPNSALPHHYPGERLLQEGDAIIIDMGAQYQGYKSDLTRTFYLGNEPSAKFWHLYRLVHEAQLEAINTMRPGMTGIEIDALARNVITKGGHGSHFGHGLGHGVGLDIHEGPRFSIRDKTAVPAHVIVTVEPGVYLPEWGGIRIEDLVYLTESGCQFLSHSPKDPVIPIQ